MTKPTPRQRQLLEIMRDDNEYIVQSGREVWVGLERTSVALLYHFHRMMWIKEESSQARDESYLIYAISETGRKAIIDD